MTSYLFFVIITLIIEIIIVVEGEVFIMKYNLIEQSSDRYIYMIERNNSKFYMVIPSDINVDIVLGIFSSETLENVKKIPHINGKAVIVPELTKEHLDYLKAPRVSYEQASGYFSSVINMAQGILVNSKKQVNPKVYFNNNRDFSSFINWYVGAINKPDRFVIGNIFDINNNIEMANIPFGIKEDLPFSDNVQTNNVENQEIEQTKGVARTRKREPGFVSYVLLGVIVAIMSLIFLYMLL